MIWIPLAAGLALVWYLAIRGWGSLETFERVIMIGWSTFLALWGGAMGWAGAL